MKFSLFVHMERLDASQTHQELYEEFVQLCEIADRGGMHAIWTGEHHGMDFTIAPNPFINIADLARRTKNVRLGTGTVIAPFWHPIKLAGEAAMTDIVTGGRLDVGIARGAYGFEYERLHPGLDAWGAGLRMRELIPALKGVWAGDYAHDGEFWKFPSTTSAPKPVQTPHPPIWVAARDPNSHEFAVSQGCNVQVTPLWNGDAEIESLMGRFNAACKKNPDIAKPKIMLLLHTYVGSDDADVQQAMKEVSVYYNYFFAWFKNERPIHQGLIERLSEEDIAANAMLGPDVMRANMPIGTSDEVIGRLKAYEALGYDEYSFWIDTGMSFERKKASLERFIAEVMPAFG
ncbi:alkanesulfonate monooxygenase SsuD/methylene tetrahydromethanopterin reductase-like flavin-dependent oxidoreductase (luciferase family) [Rhizobium sp. SG_E_25_P2]|uniref:LLM class flavin-dependent oxidoreductase n=1 Tax=Rhizobium sp. SG_E_25_P2 TaxID=2879942 RepID=UPI0024745764|nr:LLM class flavin-dependent oxidoreductase [Rhizobium sp. SG_E_25_P2]MDH6265175.1 alkanesulfonate monooxygenase SsuD/methylene tetrahydromethanopterin reductase-like flavin-dependent oxidoreductase (luciferase family) [Rhizobium sp. SG_E_25_P2]